MELRECDQWEKKFGDLVIQMVWYGGFVNCIGCLYNLNESTIYSEWIEKC